MCPTLFKANQWTSIQENYSRFFYFFKINIKCKITNSQFQRPNFFSEIPKSDYQTNEIMFINKEIDTLMTDVS